MIVIGFGVGLPPAPYQCLGLRVRFGCVKEGLRLGS